MDVSGNTLPVGPAAADTRPLLTAPLRPVRPEPAAPHRTGRDLSPLQVVCWQVAALSVVLTVREPWPVLVATSAGAAVVLALTTIRTGGRWLYEPAFLGAAFLIRRRRADLPTSGGVPATTLALLKTLVPGATVRTVETAQGPAAAISHQGGLTALLRPSAPTPDLLSRLPMPADLLPTADHTLGVQLVVHAGLRPDTPRRLWVAVHAARTVETPDDAGLALVLRNAMRRVRRALDRAGVPVEPLAEEQALSAIAGLAHITGGRTVVREDWRYWRTGQVSQATYRLAGWDGKAHGLVDGLPGVASTIALGIRTGRRPHAVLRLAATTEAAVEAAAGHLTNRLAPHGVRLTRLDGTHSAGVAASLPIGVTPRSAIADRADRTRPADLPDTASDRRDRR